MKNAIPNSLGVLVLGAIFFSACSSAGTDENGARKPFAGGAGGTSGSGMQAMGGRGGAMGGMGGVSGGEPGLGGGDAGMAGSGGSPTRADAGVAGRGGTGGSGGQGGSGGASDEEEPVCEASAPDELQPITDEYSYLGVSPSNAQYKDSPHFRVYYDGSSLADVAESSVDTASNHLEAAYGCFVTDWCFRSPGLSVHSDDGPYYKMNIYPTDTLNAGGVMLYDARAGLSYLEVRGSQLPRPQVTVHEFGHSLALTEYNWVEQTRTGAWWETVANWVADTYLTSSYCEDARARFGIETGRTIIDLDTVIGRSHLTICHEQNLYQAWPFLTYLTNNPDGYSGLGRMAVRDLFRQHQRNNETPLHVLERVASPVSVQTILGRYWARMAYLDIGHPQAQEAFFDNRSRLNFSSLTSVGNQTYRVNEDRRPMYGGANIIPLDVTGDGNVTVDVTNLGNGLPESNFTATLAIREESRSVRYVELENGSARATIGSDEEATLVVANTPDTLYQYDPFQSDGPELEGLNYEVEISGAAPAN